MAKSQSDRAPASSQAPKLARQPSLKQLNAAARKRWGKRAYVQHRPSAPDAKTRDEWQRLNEEATNRLRSIEFELKHLRATDILAAMAKAAQFVVDVNGDHPSIDGLQKPLADASRRAELLAEQSELTDERKRRFCGIKRYSAIQAQVVAGIGMGLHLCEADTAAELMERISEGGAA